MPLPLAGLSILVTRPKDQSAALSELLQELGAEVVVMPLTRIEPPETWDELDGCIEKLSSYHWIVFASVNAVSFFFQRLRTKRMTADLGALKIAAIGPGTAKAVEKEGLSATFTPPEFVAESLVKSFPGYPELEGTRVLWPKTNIGRTLIADQLRAAGAIVDIVHCYRTVPPENPEQIAEDLSALIQGKKIDIITLTSSQTAKNLAEVLLWKGDPKGILRDIVVAVIGPETARSARQYLGKVDVEAASYTVEGLVRSLCEAIPLHKGRRNNE